MSKFTEHHLSSLDLLLNAKIKQVKDQLPTLADAFEKRTREELRTPITLLLDQVESIRTSGRYSDQGLRTELRLAARGFTEQRLSTLRKDTVEKLEAQRLARQEAVLAPKKPVTDPALALVQEMQRQELRRELRSLDPLALQTRLRSAAATEAGDLLLDAIESDPIARAGGKPIVGADVLRDTKAQMAIAADPQLGELAMLRDAYQFVIGACEQMVLSASGLSDREVATSPTPSKSDGPKPILVSTGQPV